MAGFVLKLSNIAAFLGSSWIKVVLFFKLSFNWTFRGPTKPGLSSLIFDLVVPVNKFINNFVVYRMALSAARVTDERKKTFNLSFKNRNFSFFLFLSGCVLTHNVLVCGLQNKVEKVPVIAQGSVKLLAYSCWIKVHVLLRLILFWYQNKIC